MSQENILIQNRIDEAENIVKKIALDLGYSQSQLQILQDRLEKGEPLYKILQMSDALVEERYTMALEFYKNNNFKSAEGLFRWLCLFNGTAPANWMGLGATLQGQEKWEEAATAYSMALAWSQEKNPKPLYYLGVSQYMLGKKDLAQKNLEEFVFQSSFENKEERELVKRACTILESLEGEKQ